MGGRAPGALAVMVLLASVSTGCVMAGGAAAARERFHAEQRGCYDPPPAAPAAEVPETVVDARANFWKTVESDLPAFLPLLREALLDPARSRDFAVEGAGFLTEHAEGKGDFQVAADALARWGPRFQDRAYFDLCSRLCREDIDAYAMISRCLERPADAAPELERQYRTYLGGFVFRCFLANGEDRWAGRLAERILVEADGPAALQILDCLSYAVTPEADEALRSIAADPKADNTLRVLAAMAPLLPGRAPLPRKVRMTTTRNEFEAFLAASEAAGRIPPGTDEERMFRDGLYLVEAGDASRIRAVRRMTAFRLSDEAGYEIEYLTILLRRAAVLQKVAGSPAPVSPPPAAR